MQAPVIAHPAEGMDSASGIGRAFADALHAGLARVAHERVPAAVSGFAGNPPQVSSARSGSSPSLAFVTSPAPVNELLKEHTESVVRYFESRLPTVLEPMDRHDPGLRSGLVAHARRILANATGAGRRAAPEAPAATDRRAVAPHQETVAATLLMECALASLLDGSPGPPGNGSGPSGPAPRAALEAMQALGRAIRRNGDFTDPQGPLDCCWQERRRIARDLHDHLGHSLRTAVGLADSLLEAHRPEADCRPELGVQALLVQAQEQLRGLVTGLVEHSALPPLREAVQRYVADTAPPGIDVAVKVTGNERLVPDAPRRDLYLVIREALHNSLSHAQADRIAVSIRFTRWWVHAGVSDNGCGFDTERELAPGHAGQGIRSMTERMEDIAGQLTVESSPGRGTRVDARLPIRPPTPQRKGA
ncbi:histidine kinase [Streptomyces sp. A3M-1-3]|uniref:sensor histidine kinase n=1 Tax=Streptomyces sp. A3M-1-3 TaxID=2962044 RepID=UPI0020B8DF36|nr:ATP-binding protein [Streptomyces sp. A3M-1-3]MCP3822746.1 histidine kinase [Streptomyces sp. A3M-1-3]